MFELKCIRRKELLQTDFILNSTMGSFHFSEPQYFYPTIEKFYKIPSQVLAKNLQLNLGEDLFKIIDETHIVLSGKTIPVFFKHLSLLDPFQFIMGKFKVDGINSRNKEIETVDKLTNPQSSVYVDIIGSQLLGYLSRTNKCPSFPIFYGSLLGKSDVYKFDITDEYEDLISYPNFNKRLGFSVEGAPEVEEVSISDEIRSEVSRKSSKTDKSEILESVWDLSSCHSYFSEESEESDNNSNSDYESEYETDYETEEEITATLHNIPSGIIIQEKLEGTLYELLSGNYSYNKDEWISWFFQLCFALAYAQKHVGFFHNDLHTNNVMWTHTDIEYLNYKVDNKYYKVPTFGKIIKIIDYGRSIITVDVSGIKKPITLMSDQLEEDNEAGGQYNWGEYRNESYQEIPPNPSFDIVYFVYNMIDFHSEEDSVGEFMSKILRDTEGKYIHVREDGNERYHGFDIYKAIARKCNAGVPSDLLEDVIFEVFEVKSIDSMRLLEDSVVYEL
jgi:hypothetical protein